MNVATVEHAIRDIREIVRLDGADLVVASARDHEITLELVLEDASCSDCVMSRATIEKIVLMHLTESLPAISQVTLHDPREVNHDDRHGT